MVKRAIVVVALVWVLASCSLFGPAPGRISQWFTPPEPGTTYTYTITTTWADSSISTEDRDYLVERVEDRGDRTTLVKLADSRHLTSLFWIVDRANDAIYESADDVIDQLDLLVLLAPVEDGARWSSGPTDAEIDYEIERIRSSQNTEVGELSDVVRVVCSYDNASDAEITVEWAPDAGLVRYEEDFDTSASYIHRYERELTAVTPP